MFAHEVIKSLRQLEVKGNYLSQDSKFIDSLESTREVIRISHKFHLGKLSGYTNVLTNMGGDYFLGENGDNVKCPYPVMWFDYVVDIGDAQTIPNNPNESSKRGMIVIEALPNFISVQNMSYIDVEHRWLPSLIRHMYLIGDTFNNRLDVIDYINSSAKPNGDTVKPNSALRNTNYWVVAVGDYINQMATSGQKGFDAFIEFATEDANEITTLNMALRLLNCKNIVSEDITPMRRVRKKKKKVLVPSKRKFSYKVLNLVLPSKRKKSHIGEDTNTHKRVHFCRGHFKTYTEDSALFGKYVGTYWWANHVRGTPAEGMVVKDYKVKKKK